MVGKFPFRRSAGLVPASAFARCGDLLVSLEHHRRKPSLRHISGRPFADSPTGPLDGLDTFGQQAAPLIGPEDGWCETVQFLDLDNGALPHRLEKRVYGGSAAVLDVNLRAWGFPLGLASFRFPRRLGVDVGSNIKFSTHC